MKDKIIEIKEGTNFYVLEELKYNDKKYIFGAKCDLEKDTIEENNFIIQEVTIKDNQLVLNDLENEEEAKIIANMFIEKIGNAEDQN